jgi:uncharacterized protein
MEPPDVVPFAEAIQRKFAADDPSVIAKPVEETHVQAVQHLFDALGAGDLDAFFDAMQPDVELEIHAPPEFAWIRRARGTDQVRQAVMHNFGTLRSQHPQLLTLVAQGHIIVLVGRERGEVRASGHPYDVHFVYEFTFRDDKIQHIREIAAATSA